MAIKSFRSREFRRRLRPERLVLVRVETAHAGVRDSVKLQFKKLRGENWSARVGIHYRAIGHFVKDGFLWEWIGTHEEYNRLT